MKIDCFVLTETRQHGVAQTMRLAAFHISHMLLVILD